MNIKVQQNEYSKILMVSGGKCSPMVSIYKRARARVRARARNQRIEG